MVLFPSYHYLWEYEWLDWSRCCEFLRKYQLLGVYHSWTESCDGCSMEFLQRNLLILSLFPGLLLSVSVAVSMIIICEIKSLKKCRNWACFSVMTNCGCGLNNGCITILSLMCYKMWIVQVCIYVTTKCLWQN